MSLQCHDNASKLSMHGHWHILLIPRKHGGQCASITNTMSNRMVLPVVVQCHTALDIRLLFIMPGER
eukprot:352020-Chlamydomonas_euryale.AAC.10